ncbi:hypothetical protein C491_18114 [Natronococcus amylolyticus DSM 10524]|uniref:Uncharacterized protein n=1 Tax=Natronococcus amylolyticus DSM 10524 TaxID=1227497 RepID=L9X1U9_9EURY|nr:hypothetical protein C491_18114 [Natronococcus amylolyticus DSM 10524]
MIAAAGYPQLIDGSMIGDKRS